MVNNHQTPNCLGPISRTVSVDCRLQRDDGLLRVDRFAHLLRDAEEAIVGQVAPSQRRAAPLRQARPRCSSGKKSHGVPMVGVCGGPRRTAEGELELWRTDAGCGHDASAYATPRSSRPPRPRSLTSYTPDLHMTG